MQGKGMRMHPTVFDKAGFGKPPEALDTIDVGLVCGELILSMIDSQVLSIPNVDKAVVATPAIGVDDAIQADLSPNKLLQRGVRAIGDDFGVHAAVAFEDAKDDGFSVSAPAPFPFHAAGPEEGFIHFDLPSERGSGVAELGQSHANGAKITVDRVPTQTGQGSNLRGIEINRKQAHQLPEFTL